MSDANPSPILQSFVEANEKLRQLSGATEGEREILRIDTTFTSDSLGNQTTEIAALDTVYNEASLTNQGPLFDIFTLNSAGQFSPAVMGTSERNQRKIVDEYFSRPEVKSLFPADIEFKWSKDPVKAQEDTEGLTETTYSLYAIKKGQ